MEETGSESESQCMAGVINTFTATIYIFVTAGYINMFACLIAFTVLLEMQICTDKCFEQLLSLDGKKYIYGTMVPGMAVYSCVRIRHICIYCVLSNGYL